MLSDKMALKIVFLLVLASVNLVYADDGENDGKFLYFAYGSNLLARRLHIDNPSAAFYGTATLEGYRLDFNVYSDLWNGAAATIVEDPGEIVWGDLWLLDISNLKSLDDQEGVSDGFYFVKNVTVQMPNGISVVARTYEEVLTPSKLQKGEERPFDRTPSNTYLEVIINGAIESKLPSDYITFLRSFPSNGKIATEKILKQLGYQV